MYALIIFFSGLGVLPQTKPPCLKIVELIIKLIKVLIPHGPSTAFFVLGP